MLKKICTFMIICTVLLAGCKGNKEPESVKEEGSTSTNNSQVYPLTGLEAEEGDDHRAIAVMVNNHPKARPQSGLSKADVVYEVLAESNITRFLAIYQSEFPETFGPVRSARDYYIRLAKGYDSLFVFHGWSPEAKKLIESNYIDSLNGLNYDGTLFERASFRKAPHNSYITYDHVMKGAEEKGYDMNSGTPEYTFMTEEEAQELEGESYTKISVSYNSPSFDVTYEYNEDSEMYSRYTAGVRTEDYGTNDPVELANILIIEAEHKVVDKKGRRDIDLESGGNAYLLQKGKLHKIQWESKDHRIIPVVDGEEVKLVPGKTWINVMPISGLTQSVTLSNN
ncbi:DUF3048 domain-containing protein [Pradoshia sp.]